MADQEKREPDKWHRIGVVMSLVSLVVFLISLVFLVKQMPAGWETVTRHSDRPSQVVEGIQGLVAEIDLHQSEVAWRLSEIQAVRARATVKASECRDGIGEPGETVDERKRNELIARAPEWDRVAAEADSALLRLTGRP